MVYSQLYAIITGPNTFEITFTVWTPEGGAEATIYTVKPEIILYTQTLDEGIQIIEVHYEVTYTDVTLLGPTSYMAIFTGLGNNDKGRDGTQITGAHCSQTAISSQATLALANVTTLTILTADQTLSTIAWWIEDTTFPTETFTGPSAVLFTTIDQLVPELDDPIQMEPVSRFWDGIYGACSLYFSLVYVYYWLVHPLIQLA